MQNDSSLDGIPVQHHNPYGKPIGTVDLFNGSATPTETNSSGSWTDQVKGNDDEAAEGQSAAEGRSSNGADPAGECDDEMPGSQLTSLLNPIY